MKKSIFIVIVSVVIGLTGIAIFRNKMDPKSIIPKLVSDEIIGEIEKESLEGDISEQYIPENSVHNVVSLESVSIGDIPETQIPQVDMPRVQLIK